jgi:peptidylprolyl isomerase
MIVRLCILSLVFSSLSVFAETKWRTLNNDNVVLMTLPQGKVVIELTPEFTPKHVEQLKSLIKNNHYNGTTFYRVIDGFVAQAGPKDGSFKDKMVSTLKLEGEWEPNKNWSFTHVQHNDLFAEQTGFINGFPAAYSTTENKAWFTHCPGVVAMARGNNKHSATSHFYITNGQAPRYLDRLMTIFGRVVYGMEHVHSITRTAVIEGESAVNKKDYTPIVTMQLMSDVPKADQIHLAVEDTDSTEFSARLIKRKERKNPFFFKAPPQVLDVCQIPIKSKLLK